MAAGPDVQRWATEISTHNQNGRKIIFRFVKDFSPAFDRASQPICMIIVWRYRSEFGQPNSDEHQQMNMLEDALGPVLEQGRFATLALVSTGEDLREWTYYAKSEAALTARLDSAFAGMPVFPIDIHIAEDPGWETYEEFKSGLRLPVE